MPEPPAEHEVPSIPSRVDGADVPVIEDEMRLEVQPPLAGPASSTTGVKREGAVDLDAHVRPSARPRTSLPSSSWPAFVLPARPR